MTSHKDTNDRIPPVLPTIQWQIPLVLPLVRTLNRPKASPHRRWLMIRRLILGHLRKGCTQRIYQYLMRSRPLHRVLLQSEALHDPSQMAKGLPHGRPSRRPKFRSSINLCQSRWRIHPMSHLLARLTPGTTRMPHPQFHQTSQAPRFHYLIRVPSPRWPQQKQVLHRLPEYSGNSSSWEWRSARRLCLVPPGARVCSLSCLLRHPRDR